jgi:tRNA A-37 threonylcarbamoyl transferase component Bud32
MSESRTTTSDYNIQIFNNIYLVIEGTKSFSIKNDSSTSVYIIDGSEFGITHDLFVKRFNYRGFVDFLIRKIIGSRARRLYCTTVKLCEKHLPVPIPITYIAPSLKQRSSIFISRVIDNADNLANIYKQGLFHKIDRLAEQLSKTLVTWHLSGAVHGDLKWSNILLQRKNDDLNFYFIDLDHAKLNNMPQRRGIIKDLTRFYRYGLELDAEDWVNTNFFSEYLRLIPQEIRKKIHLSSIKNHAWNDWIKKGKKTKN